MRFKRIKGLIAMLMLVFCIMSLTAMAASACGCGPSCGYGCGCGPSCGCDCGCGPIEDISYSAVSSATTVEIANVIYDNDYGCGCDGGFGCCNGC